MIYICKPLNLINAIASTLFITCLLTMPKLEGAPETKYFLEGNLPQELSMYEGQGNVSLTILKGWATEKHHYN